MFQRVSSNRFLGKQLACDIGLILFLTMVGTALSWAFHPDYPTASTGSNEPPSITVEEALTMEVLWLDARDQSSYYRGHIPGALRLNEEEWEGLLEGFVERWRPDLSVVVYCSAEQCMASKQVARRIRDEFGIDNVYYLEGGWNTWIDQRH